MTNDLSGVKVNGASMLDVDTAVGDIEHEFEKIQGNGYECDTIDIWGHSGVQAAMREFCCNWEVHRGFICAAINDLRESLSDQINGWAALEDTLSDAMKEG